MRRYIELVRSYGGLWLFCTVLLFGEHVETLKFIGGAEYTEGLFRLKMILACDKSIAPIPLFLRRCTAYPDCTGVTTWIRDGQCDISKNLEHITILFFHVHISQF